LPAIFDTLIEQRRAASLVFDLDAARLAYAQACPADRIATFPLQKAALCEHEFGNYVCLHCGRETHVLRETMGRLESCLDPAPVPAGPSFRNCEPGPYQRITALVPGRLPRNPARRHRIDAHQIAQGKTRIATAAWGLADEANLYTDNYASTIILETPWSKKE